MFNLSQQRKDSMDAAAAFQDMMPSLTDACESSNKAETGEKKELEKEDCICCACGRRVTVIYGNNECPVCHAVGELSWIK